MNILKQHNSKRVKYLRNRQILGVCLKKKRILYLRPLYFFPYYVTYIQLTLKQVSKLTKTKKEKKERKENHVCIDKPYSCEKLTTD